MKLLAMLLLAVMVAGCCDMTDCVQAHEMPAGHYACCNRACVDQCWMFSFLPSCASENPDEVSCVKRSKVQP